MPAPWTAGPDFGGEEAMMSIKVKCPTCGARLKAPDAAAGRPLDCPHCAQAVPVPARAAAPPPSVAGPGEASAPEGRRGRGDGPSEPGLRQAFDELAEAHEERRAYRRADAADEDAAEADLPGAIGLGLGAAALLCLVMGCFTCGVTYWLAAPLAAAGAGCAAFSRSRLRAWALALNLLTLVPAVVAFRTAWTAASRPEPEPEPFVR
jgi:hypothetical protein